MELTMTARVYGAAAPRKMVRPISMELTSSLETPATELVISFMRGGQLLPAIELTIADGDKILFTGECDQQEMSVGEGGRMLTLTARSAAAVLLDNEIMPQALYTITARRFFRSFITPFGFTELAVPDERRSAGVFQINKGFSVWEAFTQLCWRLYAREPRMEKSGLISLLPPSAKPVATVSSRPALAEALRYTRLRELHRRATVIEKAVLRDREGNYSRTLASPFGNPYRVSRRRYVIPAAEYATNPAMDALQRMNNAQRAFHTMEATLVGLQDLYPGDRLLLDDPYFGEREMTAWRVKKRLSAGGYYTDLVLVDTIFG